MADNVTVGGVNYSTDDVTTLNGGAIAAGTAQTQRMKVQYGDDNTARDVSATFPLPTMFNDPDVVTTGSLTATDAVVAGHAGNGALLTGASTANSYLALACPGGDSAWIIQVTGTFGAGTVWFEASVDSTNGLDGTWIPVNGRQTGVVNTVLVNGATAAGMYRGNTSGIKYLRTRITGATTPNVAVNMRVAGGVGAVFLNASIPAGSNTIGAVNIAAAQTVAVTQATAASLNATVVNAAGTNAIGHLNELRAATLAVTATAAAATATTLTLPAAAAGLFHYITSLEMTLYSAAARTGVAAPILVTTTNLPGSLAYTFDTAGAIGTNVTQRPIMSTPLRTSAAATATTFVAPAVTGGIWRLTATYFTAA